MRTAILGAAASALLGGTLAVTPVTSVSSMPPAAPACTNDCNQAGSVLMPETAKPQTPNAAPAADVGGQPNRSAPAASLAAPAAGTQSPGSSGAHAVPGVASSGGGGGAPAAASPGAGAPGLAGAPDVPGMDQVAGTAAGVGSITQGAQAVQSVWGTAVGVPTSLVGLAGGAAGVLSSVSISLFYLSASGLLPKNASLPSGLNLSSIPGITLPSSLQAAAAEFKVPAGTASIPGAAAAVRGAAAAASGGRGPLATIRAAVPQAGLPQVGLPRAPQLPKTPGWRDLPHPHLPGPAAILKPHCIGPHLGPIGACIP